MLNRLGIRMKFLRTALSTYPVDRSMTTGHGGARHTLDATDKSQAEDVPVEVGGLGSFHRPPFVLKDGFAPAELNQCLLHKEA